MTGKFHVLGESLTETVTAQEKVPRYLLIDKRWWRGARHPAKKVGRSDAYHNSPF